MTVGGGVQAALMSGGGGFGQVGYRGPSQHRLAQGGYFSHTAAQGQSWPGGVVGEQQCGDGFQGMTVQQLLEAQFRVIQQQFAAQREEVRLIQQQLKQQQYSQPPPMLVRGPPPPVAGGLAWGYRPSC